LEHKKLNLGNISWEEWKKQLGNAVEFAEEMGINREQIEELAQRAGQILAENVEPANPEQKTLKELWELAGDNEKKTLVKLVTKMVNKK